MFERVVTRPLAVGDSHSSWQPDSDAPRSLLELGDPLSEPLVLGLELALGNLDLVRVLHCVINQVESVVGPVALLLDHSDILAEGLLSILELGLEPFDILLVHDLLVRLLERNLPA